MNVTLNLMTEFEDIPRELSYMLKYVEEELSFASRRAKIDQRMEDCMSILAGYSHYLENPPEQEPVEDTPEEEINDKG